MEWQIRDSKQMGFAHGLGNGLRSFLLGQFGPARLPVNARAKKKSGWADTTHCSTRPIGLQLIRENF